MKQTPPSRNLRALASLTVLAALAVRAPAQTFSRTYAFPSIKKKSISVWSPNEGRGTGPKRLIGPEWNLDGQSWDAYGDLTIPSLDFGFYKTPEVNLGRTGFQVKFGGTGRIGFEMQPYYDGGTMDLSFTGGISVTGMPLLPQPNDEITLKLKYGTSSYSSFNVTTPDMGVAVDGVFNLSGNASSTGWFLGSTLWNGNVFSPFSTQNSASILPMTMLSGDQVAYLAKVMDGANMANPLPVGASFAVPDLSVDGYTLDTNTGAISGKKYDTFMSVETDATAWILALIPGAKATVGSLVSGSTTVPGTGAVVGWDFAKIYAAMNLGFVASYKVTPTSTVGVDVYTVDANGAETKYASSETDSLTFRMPNSRIRIRPRGTLSLSLDSSLGFGMEGDFGVSPIKLTLNGKIGTGDRAETYDVEFDPAKVSWTTPTGEFDKFKRGTLDLGSVSNVFEGTYIALANLDELTPNVYASTRDTPLANASLEVLAYSLDPDTESNPVYTVSFAPEQGYTYLAYSGSKADASVTPAGSGGTEASFAPYSAVVKNQLSMTMQLRSTDLKPGRYSIKTTIDGKTKAGVVKRGYYLTPLNVNYGKGVLDGSFYVNSNKAFGINRIAADGQDKTVQIDARRLYKDTQVVMNGTVVLPRVASVDDPDLINSGQMLQFKVPAAVAKRFAGSLNTIQLRTPDLSGNGAGFILSDPKSLFIVAGKPSLSGTQYEDVANRPLPLDDRAPASFQVDGANLSRATVLRASWTRDGVATMTDLPTAYVGPTALKATLEPEFLADFHSHSSDGKIALQATTPKVDIPADYYSPAETSGGVSSPLTIGLIHPEPTIERIEPGILVKDSGAKTIKIYGKNLWRRPSAYYASKLVDSIQGATAVTFPEGPGMAAPYLLATLGPNSTPITRVGKYEVRVRYADASSAVWHLMTEHGKPELNTGTIYEVVMRANGGSLTLTGAPFYDGDATKAFANGTTQVNAHADSLTALRVEIPASVAGHSASLKVRNAAPGGGDSNTVSLRLLEGDATTIKVVPGAVVFDRATNTYRQPFTVTYVGAREVAPGARMAFTLPNAVTLQNPDGTVDGKPYLRLSLVPRRQTTVVAVWKRSAIGSMDFPRSITFPY